MELCPCGKHSLDCVIFGVFSSRIHKNKTILLGNIHFTIQLIDRAVVNLGKMHNPEAITSFFIAVPFQTTRLRK